MTHPSVSPPIGLTAGPSSFLAHEDHLLVSREDAKHFALGERAAAKVQAGGRHVQNDFRRRRGRRRLRGGGRSWGRSRLLLGRRRARDEERGDEDQAGGSGVS